MTIGAICATCAFFSPHHALDGRKGQCRFTAPLLDRSEDGYVRTVWPLVTATSWCGEHSTHEEQA